MSDETGGRPERCCSVSDVNRYVNGMMKSSPFLQDVWVCGEVSNFRPHYSGHMYFTLKDSASSLRCVMFKNAASRLRFQLENGMNVVANGAVSVFERDGQYQLYCEEIRAEGVGDLYAAFEQVKKKLSGEGLFDASRKKPLPLIPGSVCVITSPTGSVIRDIINVSLRRFPRAVIKIYPVQVQGAAAAPQIAGAIRSACGRQIADVIVVARGGGSLEDLWAFNEEIVARAIAASDIPVVSAVGHETDYTICDFVSDLRAPTPSAAAELVFPEAGALAARAAGMRKLLATALSKKLDRARLRLERCTKGAALAKPGARVEYARMRLHGAEGKLVGAMRAAHSRGAARASVLAARLDALSPLAVLARGYSIVTELPGGGVIRDSENVKAGQSAGIRLHKGKLRCVVSEVIE